MAQITIGTLSEGEIQAINSLESELIEIQKFENWLKSDDETNPIQKIVTFFAGKKSLYDDPKRMQKMIDELEKYLAVRAKIANRQARVLGKKALKSFLADSERKTRTQRQLGIITRANARQAKKRLNVAMMELKKNANILKADIEIFKANSKIAGFSTKETLAQLVRAAGDKEGLAQGFAKKVKSVTTAAIRRERSSAKIDEFRKSTPRNAQWQWITVSTKPCPDCEARAGRIMTFREWQKMGLPGSGRTICGKFCRCEFEPLDMAEDRFKTVKVFDFDKDKLVLTTASEERILNAKKHQAPQKTKT